MNNYDILNENILRRINPSTSWSSIEFKKELQSLENEFLKYIRYLMKGVEDSFTQKSLNAGKKVEDILSSHLSKVTFKNQGSVMTNTHIKADNDIDLLVITDKFYSIDTSRVKDILDDNLEGASLSQEHLLLLEKEINKNPYDLGLALQDLRENRDNSERILKEEYRQCDINLPKAIKVTDVTLTRDIDVVIASWYKNIEAICNTSEEYKGIQIYNKETKVREKVDYPFLSIKRINSKDIETKGRLKKMIRFLKNIKFLSSHDIELSSFDINAICYNIPINNYIDKKFYELIYVTMDWLKLLQTNVRLRIKLKSVDGNEEIFNLKSREYRAKVRGLAYFQKDIYQLINELKNL